MNTTMIVINDNDRSSIRALMDHATGDTPLPQGSVAAVIENVWGVVSRPGIPVETATGIIKGVVGMERYHAAEALELLQRVAGSAGTASLRVENYGNGAEWYARIKIGSVVYAEANDENPLMAALSCLSVYTQPEGAP